MKKRDRKELERYVRHIADNAEYATDAIARAVAKHLPLIGWPS